MQDYPTFIIHSKRRFSLNQWGLQIRLYRFENSGGAKVWGIEAEWKSDLSDNVSSYFNYTFQKSRDDDTGEELAETAKHKGNIGLNLALGEQMNINSNLFLVGKRYRDERDDSRSSTLPGYGLVDLALLGKISYFKDIEMRLAIHNLFDKAVR